MTTNSCCDLRGAQVAAQASIARQVLSLAGYFYGPPSSGESSIWVISLQVTTLSIRRSHMRVRAWHAPSTTL